jgi:hypothetical protein
MLMKTDVIYRGTSTPQGSARHVTGQYLAKNRLNARDRARLANKIREGRTEITDLTLKQISSICRVSVPYINDARKTSPARSITSITMNNLDTTPGTLKEQWVSAQKKKPAAGTRPIAPETLVELFRRASPAELLEWRGRSVLLLCGTT